MPFTYDYPRPSVSADVVVFSTESQSVLLIKRKKEPFANSWALPGGFMEIDESADRAAIRELKEETGIVVEQVNQIGAYSDPDRDPRGRVVTIAFWAEASENVATQAADDAVDAKWFALSELPPLAFDHEKIIADARPVFPPK